MRTNRWILWGIPIIGIFFLVWAGTAKDKLFSDPAARRPSKVYDALMASPKSPLPVLNRELFDSIQVSTNGNSLHISHPATTSDLNEAFLPFTLHKVAGNQSIDLDGTTISFQYLGVIGVTRRVSDTGLD